MEALEKIKEIKVKLWQIEFTMKITWSKFIAFLILIAAVWLDFKIGGNATFMYAIPFIVFLITGKQLIDRKKPEQK